MQGNEPDRTGYANNLTENQRDLLEALDLYCDRLRFEADAAGDSGKKQMCINVKGVVSRVLQDR